MNGVAFRIAARELAGGLRGFWIYLSCIALGAAAIAAAGSVAEVFDRGLQAEARTLLGGDVMLRAAQRRATPEERAFIDELGAAAETVGVDVMGVAGPLRRQVDVRAVDGAYPLIGEVGLSRGADTLEEALARGEDGVWGAAVSASFFDAFALAIGDRVQLGPVEARITAQIDSLPDRLGVPGTFSPEAVVSLDAFVDAGRLTTGQLFRSGYRVILSDERTKDEVEAELSERFGAGRLRVRGPEDEVDGLGELLQTLNDFLVIIGVAALVAGGVGVAQATSSFLESRTPSIAALKALGADSGTIRAAYLLQLGALAALGAGVGVAIGAAAPFALIAVAGDRIPLPASLALYPAPLLKAFSLGVLAAAVFALPAIGRARATSPASLFRSLSADRPNAQPWAERAAAIAAGAGLTAIAVFTSGRPGLTAALLLGAGLAWLGFAGVGRLVRMLAGRAAAQAAGVRRLALANLGGPGSLAPWIAPALGLGLALLSLTVAVQSNLIRQIGERAPAEAPSLVFTQIPFDEGDAFEAEVASFGVDVDDPNQFRRAPFLLGRLISLNGAKLREEDVAPGERWVVDNEIALTFLAATPPETVIAKGEWWPEDYVGPLLVSVEDEAAAGVGANVGDRLGFRIFGREIEAEVASLRRVDWGAFGIGSNAAFIFSPGALEAARPYFVAIARTSPEADGPLVQAVGQAHPDVVVFQTRPALQTAAKLVADISIAVNAAAGVVTLAGLLVLLGAFAAMARRRNREAALLKVFGAARGSILLLYAFEFAVAGGVAAIVGAGVGVAGAYPIVLQVFEAGWTFPILEIAVIVGLAILFAAAGGAAVGAATLRRPAARVLREA